MIGQYYGSSMIEVHGKHPVQPGRDPFNKEWPAQHAYSASLEYHCRKRKQCAF